MLYIIALIIICCGILFRRKKIQASFMLVFLWILFAFSYGNADYNIHLIKFTQYQNLNSQMEWLYNKLMQLFNGLGFSYKGFLIVCSVFVLLVWYMYSKKRTRNVGFVFALYLIYPFCMDVTTIRYTLAIAVVYIGMEFLGKGNKRWLLKYILCVLVASLIHVSAIFCLLFLLPKFFNTKKLTKIIAILTVVLLVASESLVVLMDKISRISFLNIGTKVSIVLNASNMKYNFASIMNYRLKMVLIFCGFLLVYYVIWKWLKHNKYSNREEINRQVSILKDALGMNISVLPLIVLLSFSADLFRIQLSLALVNYVAFAQYFDIREILHVKKEISKISLTTVSVVIGSIGLSIFCLYLWVLSSSNIDSVFRTLFENNVLFSF